MFKYFSKQFWLFYHYLKKKKIMLIGGHKVREHNVEISLIKHNQYASHTFQRMHVVVLE